MGAFLAAAYFATASLLPPSYLACRAVSRKYNYLNPILLMGTLAFFPGLAMLWFCCWLQPGLETAAVRWRLPPLAVTIDPASSAYGSRVIGTKRY